MEQSTTGRQSWRRYFVVPIMLVVPAGPLLLAGMLWWPGLQPVAWPRLVAGLGLIIVVAAPRVTSRVRSEHFFDGWSDTAFVVGVAVLPLGPWIPLALATGMAISGLLLRRPLVKTAYNVSAHIISTCAAMTVMWRLRGSHDILTIKGICAVVVAAAVLMGISFILTGWVISATTAYNLRVILRDMFRVSIITHPTRVAVGLVILWLASTPKALLVLPPLLYLLYRQRKAGRSLELAKNAWQQLSARARGASSLDEPTAVRNALADAIALWRPDRVDIEIAGVDGRLWTLNAGSNEPQSSAIGEGSRRYRENDFIVERGVGDDDASFGRIRLIFRQSVALTSEENLALDVFAASLASAISNARAHEAERASAREQHRLTLLAEASAEHSRQLADEMAHLAEQHEHVATHDPLTGLANRRLLGRAVDDAIATNGADGCFGLLLVDIRDFKAVNNSLGPAAGNELLIAIGRRLRDVTRNNDLVARTGGDEFAVLLHGFSSADGAAVAANSIARELEASFRVAGMSIKVELAAGFAVAPDDASDRDELLRCAEVALHHSKHVRRRGIERYRAHFDPANTEQVTLLDELDGALRRREIMLHYQPKYNLVNGRIIGAEALIRWQHPRRGLLAPSQFMPVLERHAAISDVTRHVLDIALADNAVWRSAGHATPIAVNISARDLFDPTLAGTVATMLDAHDVPPNRLTLEVTETAAVANVDTVATVLHQLREIGVRLSCDDFGTGYSSLSMLANYPLNELKIDRSFVGGILDDRPKQLLISTAIAAAENFGLSVVAEGIETVDQQRALIARGCEVGQGFLLSKPVPPFAIGELLKRNLRVA